MSCSVTLLNSEKSNLYINLCSSTSGSKEKKTFKHINTAKKQQKTKEKNSEQV